MVELYLPSLYFWTFISIQNGLHSSLQLSMALPSTFADHPNIRMHELEVALRSAHHLRSH